MSLLEIEGLTHSFGENLLYKNAGFTLNKGEHIGIVGQNGTGKSTLIKICTEQIIPDSGRIVWQPNTTIGYLDQYAEIDHTLTMKEFLKSAFTKLFEMEAQVLQLYEKAADGDMKSLELAARYQEQLEAHDFYSIDTVIDRVANGLGLLAIGLDRPIAEMSGGQRAKVILAKLLLEKPDVLLLDEPTNFLDKDHVAWLAEYLSSLENAFLVVSHDFDFLDKIANRICDIDNDTITKYYGTYSEFLRKKTLLREDYIRQYSAQQKEIKKTEEFIRKNIAGRKAKMARGRQKQLDRMDKMEALEQKEIIPHFHFPVLPLTNTEHTWKLERMGFFQPKLLILAIVLVIFTLGVAVECLKRKMRKLSPLECMKYTEAVTYHKSRKKPKIKKFRYWGKHPEIYLAKKYLFRNKKTFGITSLSLWLGCELALCSAVIVNGVDLQNYYSKEPDFQIGITEEACNYLIESSPDTKNMKFFPKSLMNDIETTIGNELHSVENIKGFYPIVGKNGKENIKILIDGDKISTVIQTVSIGEQEELKDFIQKNDKLVNWEQFQNNHGTIVLHDHMLVASAIVIIGVTGTFATSANASAKIDNKNSEYIESTIAKDVMLAYNDEDGNIYYSADGGETFFNEKEFNEKYPSPEVEWWTYEEYKEWLDNERIQLQSMLGEKAWTGGRGEFVWTQEMIDETIACYEEILQKIENGVKVSKTVDGSEEIQIATYDDKEHFMESVEGAAIASDKETKVFGPYDTKEELLDAIKSYCEEQVRLGNMTQQAADEIIEKYE